MTPDGAVCSSQKGLGLEVPMKGVIRILKVKNGHM